MRDGFDGVVVGVEGRGREFLAIARRTDAEDIELRAAFPGVFACGDQRLAEHLERAAPVIRVIRVNRRAVFIEERELARGRAGVDADPDVEALAPGRDLADLLGVQLPREEVVALGVAAEKRHVGIDGVETQAAGATLHSLERSPRQP